MSCCRNLGSTAFRGLLHKGKARNTGLFASRAYAVQNKYVYPISTPNNFLILSRSNPVKECVRFKSKGKGSRRKEYESDSDDESEEDLDLYQDAEGRPTRVLHGLHSLRLDNLFVKTFNLSRRRIEEIFLGGHIFLNNVAVNKSSEVHINDILEIKQTFESSETVKHIPIKKMEIIKIKPDVITKQYSLVFVILE